MERYKKNKWSLFIFFTILAAMFLLITNMVYAQSDTFDGTIIDDCKWVTFGRGNGTVSQNDRLILSVNENSNNSTARADTNYEFLGDFDVQVDFEIGEGWAAPESGHLDGATLSVLIEGILYRMTRIRFPTNGTYPPEGKDQLWLWKDTGEIVRLNSSEVSGKFRIIRISSTLYFKYDFGSGWQDLGSVIASNQPATIFLNITSIDAYQAFTTYHDNFIVNSGITTFSPCNTAPIADPNGPYLGAAGSSIAFDGTGSSDPDDDPLTFDWDWGDSYYTQDGGPNPNHTYAEADIYDVCLTVNDGKVDSDQVCTLAVVYDPSAGFVTGGGWIDSPAGAYVDNPILAGKASFGLLSKYKKGSTVPTGQTEFQFQTADLNFHSSSYEWLVVTGSDYAMFKGIGTINGAGDYKFKLWAGDNETDTFRIKIWEEDEATAVETVIYDNGSDQPISAGSIVIHTKK